MAGVESVLNTDMTVLKVSDNTERYPDKTMTDKEWDKYLEKIDKVLEFQGEQAKQDAENNLKQADDEREENRQAWLEDISSLMREGKCLILDKINSSDQEDHETLVKSNVPYSYLEKNGMIQYNGVTFMCDEENNAICLGDMTNPDDVLTIQLADGGSLKVNRRSLGELGKAIGMFSPEDIGRILRGIAQDAKAQETKYDIEDEESDTVSELV